MAQVAVGERTYPWELAAENIAVKKHSSPKNPEFPGFFTSRTPPDATQNPCARV
jgi:hypothetical protein